VLVGLGIDLDLGQDGLGGRAVGGHQVLPGHVAVAAAAGGLAVEADDQPLAGRQPRGHPGRQGRLEGGGVEGAEEQREGGLARRLAAREAEGVCQGEAPLAAELGDGLISLAAGEHGQYRQRQHGRERVAAALARARVGDRGQGFQQGEGG
jgi:hypothetical protein